MTEPFLLSRLLDAPRDRVWQAWTDPEHLKHWWGPKGFVVEKLTLDLRPGGLMHYCLRAPDGMTLWGRFRFLEIVKPERLVWVNSFSDPEGGVTTHPMSPDWPRELHSTATFEAQGKKTLLTVRWLPMEGTPPKQVQTFDQGRPSMTQGWTGTMEQLTAYLALE